MRRSGGPISCMHLGAEFGANGQTETTDESLVADAYDFDFQADTWVNLIFSAVTETDYIELMTQSGAEFYEIEILATAPEPTVVRALSWGQIKQR